MLRFVVTRKDRKEAEIVETVDSNNNINNSNHVLKLDVNNKTNSETGQVEEEVTSPTPKCTKCNIIDSATPNSNDTPNRRCKRRRMAETREAIIDRQKRTSHLRSSSIGSSISTGTDDEDKLSIRSTPRYLSRWNDPPGGNENEGEIDLDSVDFNLEEIPQFQRYFRTSRVSESSQTNHQQQPLHHDSLDYRPGGTLTPGHKYLSCASIDTCFSNASTNELSTQTGSESSCSSIACFRRGSFTNLSMELKKRHNCKKYGFTVVGGIDSTKGPMGIFVKTVHPDGLATGQLYRGDEIVSVNGKDLAGMTHSEALQAIKSSGKEGSLKLNLRRMKVNIRTSRTDSCDEGIMSSSNNDSPAHSSPQVNNNNTLTNLLHHHHHHHRNDDDTTANLTTITQKLRQLSTRLKHDEEEHLTTTSSIPLLSKSQQPYDDRLKHLCDAETTSHSTEDLSINTPTNYHRHDVTAGGYSDDDRTGDDDDDDTVSFSNNEDDSNTNSNNNNSGISRLMTRAAYDFTERYNSSFLDRLKLDKVFILEC